MTNSINRSMISFKEYIKEEKIAGLVSKSEKSGVPYGILKKSYDRGMHGELVIARCITTTMGICKSKFYVDWW